MSSVNRSVADAVHLAVSQEFNAAAEARHQEFLAGMYVKSGLTERDVAEREQRHIAGQWATTNAFAGLSVNAFAAREQQGMSR